MQKKNLILQQKNHQIQVSNFFKTAVIINLLILIGSTAVHAQSRDIFDKIQFDNNSNGKVRIVQSDSLAKLVNLHLWEESKMRGIWGWRIRIYRGSGPTAAKELEEARAKLLRVRDDVVDYIEFDSPFYLLEVGDFRTKSEALKFLETIDSAFPEQLYTIRTKINYPKL